LSKCSARDACNSQIWRYFDPKDLIKRFQAFMGMSFTA
jgi:hypothetical protein